MEELGRTSLAFQSGKSDKVYNVTLQLDSATNSFRVICYYGRRGAALQSHERSRSVGETLHGAQEIYLSAIREKQAKGYRIVDQESLRTVTRSQNVPIARSATPPPSATLRATTELERLGLRQNIHFGMSNAEEFWNRLIDPGWRAFALNESRERISAPVQAPEPVQIVSPKAKRKYRFD